MRRTHRMSGRSGILAGVLTTLAAPGLAGCSLKYEFPEPDTNGLAELDRLIQSGLVVDTGAVPVEPPSAPFVASLKHAHGKYFVRARLNGRPAELMLDFGSWVTLGLMPYMVRSAGATLSDASMPSSTLDGEGAMRTGLVEAVRIGDVTLRDVPFAMSPRDLTVRMAGLIVYRGHGMLGLPIIASYERFAIDLETNRLYLGKLPKALLESPEIVRLPLRTGEGMWIDVRIEGVPFKLKVDIGGYEGSVLLYGSAAEAFMEGRPSKHVGHSTALGDAVHRRYAARAGLVQAGDYALRDVVISLLPEAGGSDEEGGEREAADARHGVVGNRFFGDTIVGVEWDAGELYFVPTRERQSDE